MIECWYWSILWWAALGLLVAAVQQAMSLHTTLWNMFILTHVPISSILGYAVCSSVHPPAVPPRPPRDPAPAPVWMAKSSAPVGAGVGVTKVTGWSWLYPSSNQA